MDRNYFIELILLVIFKYGHGFSSGDWIEIDGCYALNETMVNQTYTSANEAGKCLHMCTTNTVALQGETCFCMSSEPYRTTESFCNRTCSGDPRLRCGGDASVSVYKARPDISVKWRSLNGLECLTYRANSDNINDGLFEPENCTENHTYYCYDEFKNPQEHCKRGRKGSKTWSGALDDCRSGGSIHSHLWPANDECREPYVPNEKFWVAVYQWTKVITTPTTTSTTTTTSTSTTTRTSPTSPTSSSSTSTTSPSTSPSRTTRISTSTTTSTSPTTTTTTSTSTITTTGPSTTTTSPTTSPSTSSASTSASTTTTSTTSKHNNSAITLSFKSSTATTFWPENGSSSEATTTKYGVPDVESLSAKEARNFTIDAPNIGIGLGIGILLGCLISIAIAYCRKRQRQRGRSNSSNHPLDDELLHVSSSKTNERQANGHIERHRVTSNSAINFSNFGLGTREYDRKINTSNAPEQELKNSGNSDTSQGHHNAEENDDAMSSVDL